MRIDEIELNKNEEVSLRGIIIFELANAYSKSEAMVPCLYKNRDSKIKVFKQGDNPFENHEFDAFDGKLVEVIGTFGRGGVFNVNKIQEIDYNKKED